ncbi:MAG TPA: DUF6526 family protein [Puia sp.]|jgi:hypothetical protein
MKAQNYANHRRYVFPYHILTSVPIVYLFVSALIGLFHGHRYAVNLLILSLILMSFFLYIRRFALRAQDRAIRAEESLRYFILTGKALPGQLTISQVIALRFAGDGEFVQLAQRAVAEGMTNDQIKKAITNWRPDHLRV